MTRVPSAQRRLVALDVDGTLLDEDGRATPAVMDAVTAAIEAGHHLLLATGRSAVSALPVAKLLSIEGRYHVCSNGAVTMRRDRRASGGYRRIRVETFDSGPLLRTLAGLVSTGIFAVEDRHGTLLYTEGFPETGVNTRRVNFDEMLDIQAARIVVVSPEHTSEDFLGVVEQMGLHRASYTVGWAAWLDIAPEGVNKATALERVRQRMRIPRDRVVAVGDGRNDIEMLEWAGAEGIGAAMGHAPQEVLDAGSEVVAPFWEDGVVSVLRRLPGVN